MAKLKQNRPEEVVGLTQTMRSNLDKMIKDQNDERFLKDAALPTVPKISTNPRIVQINTGKSTFIASNDSHNKQSNNGFSRNALGGFYAH